MFCILPLDDIVINYIGVLILFIVMYILSISAIRKNNEDTEYTKNIKLSRYKKILLGFFFYKREKVEIEAVINQIVNYILTVIFAILALYVDLQPKIVGICYIGAFFIVIGVCLIYRFKNNDFKKSNDHYK